MVYAASAGSDHAIVKAEESPAKTFAYSRGQPRILVVGSYARTRHLGSFSSVAEESQKAERLAASLNLVSLMMTSSRQSFHCPRHELLFWRCGGLRHHSGTLAAAAPSALGAGGCWFFLPSWSGGFQHSRFKSSGTARAVSHLSCNPQVCPH